ncbi:hypothetical protein BO86DRAFT_432093 [Aspergillus japonicus CBS 114.51]|uniref:Uncharacterized protein n=2 Tax=Aspergillus TaxID=5052 RepID=A0A2V5H2F5_ASPV1|nr:hypothetical protein BO86DRAFT_432093 [Aspergillus japonicus CBS 114.51]PYI16012.1 hypothetical protein BO99DRAFT_445738 [Aspergillus violaceofuscus CBS 115571]RAH86663.1 hypothetical protein BO86DRAFT_432093 [Aspergillus japonicus CBS 114.51]
MLAQALKKSLVVAALGLSAVLPTALAQQSANASTLVSRRLTEYLLPVATETHEFARVPNTNFVLLSQMSDSALIKIELDPATEEPIAWQSFPMGRNRSSQLHGVWPSTLYPGLMWLTLQAENQLLLVDPGRTLASKPVVVRTLDIPVPGNGPHCVFEIGNRVWAGLKVASPQTGQYYVFSADVSHLNATAVATVRDPKLYPCLNSPVFIKEEPATGLIYVTQDTDSSIMRINATSGETAQLAIPPAVGNNAVGMVAIATGPLRGVWFTLAGNATGGTGTFGHIGADGAMAFFKLQHPLLGTNAGLLHIADASSSSSTEAGGGGPALWLLSTSLLSSNSPDALIRVTFDANLTAVADEEYVSMPTQNAMVHRVLPLDTTVLVSELHTFTLAQLAYVHTVAGQWLPAEAVTNTTVYTQAG